MRRYYVDYSNNAKNRKDGLILKLQSQNNKAFLKLRDDYANESLEEFVTNKSEQKKVIEFRDEIVQKLDPVYMDPEHKLIKAHFYSPVKRIFGQEMDTYWVNVIVLWFITVVIYFILYFRLLKNILDSGGTLMGRKQKGSE